MTGTAASIQVGDLLIYKDGSVMRVERLTPEEKGRMLLIEQRNTQTGEVAWTRRRPDETAVP